MQPGTLAQLFMRERNFTIALFSTFFFIGGRLDAQINVSANYTAAALAQKLAGPGVTILNPVLTCPSLANGIFKTIVSNIGIDSGIVLTTGLAATDASGIGVNGGAFSRASTRNNAPGDAALEPLAGQATHDACALEFDVIPQGDTVKFNYVFGSEEYINATCGPYNDAFAFFISGPGISGTENMALVPGSNIPVTINSINSGIPGPNYSISGCNSMGPGSPFIGYFINNNSGATVTYEGFTKVLKAYHPVTPCNTYHLKMVIADGGNYIYDSGVFIAAGSLQANTLSVVPVSADNTVDRTAAFAVKGCAPGHFRIHRPQEKALPETVRYIIAGNAVNGYDYQQISDSIIIPAGQQDAEVLIRGLATPASGARQVKLLIKSPNNCSGAAIADSASLTLLDTIHARIITPDTTICKGEKALLYAEGDTQLTYRWQPAFLLENANGKKAVAVPDATTKYVLSASWLLAGCAPKTDTVVVAVLPVPIVTTVQDERTCLHDTFQFAATVMPAYNGYSYTWSGPNGFSSNSLNAQIINVLSVAKGSYILSVGLDTNRCVGRDTFALDVIVTPVPVTEPVIFCQGKPASVLTAAGIQLQWYTAPVGGMSSSKIIPVTDVLGLTDYYVTQTASGCESERALLPVEVKICCDKPVFMPSAFTPNGDGHNDVFAPQLPGYGNSSARLRIYNRWGQMVFESFNGKGWDGRWQDRDLEAGTYFYEALVNCRLGAQQSFKGDVLLLR